MSEDDSKQSKQTVYYKDKAAYNQALLEALKDVRKKRVDDPARGFPNAVAAFEGVLLPDELLEVQEYKLDVRPYKEKIEEAKAAASKADNEALQVEILISYYKRISWPLFRGLCKFLLENGKFPDVSGNGQVDRDDVTIVIYEALQEKILDVLQGHGWLTFSSEGEIAGGGGIGLKPKENPEDEDEIDDDLDFLEEKK